MGNAPIYTWSPQIGVPNHGCPAQVWCNGVTVAIVEPTELPKIANIRAMVMAEALEIAATGGNEILTQAHEENPNERATGQA